MQVLAWCAAQMNEASRASERQAVAFLVKEHLKKFEAEPQIPANVSKLSQKAWATKALYAVHKIICKGTPSTDSSSTSFQDCYRSYDDRIVHFPGEERAHQSSPSDVSPLDKADGELMTRIFSLIT